MHGPHSWSLRGPGARTTGSPRRQYLNHIRTEAPGKEAAQNHHYAGGEKGSALTLQDLLASLQANRTAASGSPSGYHSQQPSTTPFPKGAPEKAIQGEEWVEDPLRVSTSSSNMCWHSGAVSIF